MAGQPKRCAGVGSPSAVRNHCRTTGRKRSRGSTISMELLYPWTASFRWCPSKLVPRLRLGTHFARLRLARSNEERETSICVNASRQSLLDCVPRQSLGTRIWAEASFRRGRAEELFSDREDHGIGVDGAQNVEGNAGTFDGSQPGRDFRTGIDTVRRFGNDLGGADHLAMVRVARPQFLFLAGEVPREFQAGFICALQIGGAGLAVRVIPGGFQGGKQAAKVRRLAAGCELLAGRFESGCGAFTGEAAQ